MDNDDDVIDYFLENNANWVICEYFMQGNCKFGENCQHMHPTWMDKTKPKAKKKVGKGGRIEYEGDQECVICLEPVLANGKRFGILESCDHCFCLDCIRDWRATYDKKIKKTHYRTCPICRENSYLVIPSTKHIGWGPEKEDLIAEYTGALEEIPCRHFNKGKGYCPFQNSCYYAHYLENGEWYDYPFKETYIDEDGVQHEVHGDNEPTLAQLIGNI